MYSSFTLLLERSVHRTFNKPPWEYSESVPALGYNKNDRHVCGHLATLIQGEMK